MMQTVSITSKRQLTIPAALYREMSLRQGQKLLASYSDNRLILTPAETILNQLAGSVNVPPHLKNINLNKAVELAKIHHFSQKYAENFR